MRNGFRIALQLILVVCSFVTIQTAQCAGLNLLDESLGAPFRIRDYTFPSFLVLGFAPAPAAPLGKGHSAFEAHFSSVNNFQMSPAVSEYLQQTRGAGSRPLDAADVAFILGLPKGQSFYVDGEVNIFEFVVHWGVTERLDLGIDFSYIGYGGGSLDNTIFAFHDTFGINQHSRDLVLDNRFQVVLGITDNEGLVLLSSPTGGGMSDPSIYLRYALPEVSESWRFNLTTGIKVPIADKDVFLSTGSWDIGFQFIADKRFQRDAIIFNVGIVFPGDFKQRDFSPPNLPFFNVNWIHRLKSFPTTRYFLQMLLADHPFRDTVNSELSELEFQLTTGFKWDTSMGTFGLGLTENIFNFDNTPDIGLHFTWGILY